MFLQEWLLIYSSEDSAPPHPEVQLPVRLHRANFRMDHNDLDYNNMDYNNMDYGTMDSHYSR